MSETIINDQDQADTQNVRTPAESVRQADGITESGNNVPTPDATPADDVSETDTTEGVSETDTQADEQDTFPRPYVEKLRKENAGYREKAKRADEYAHRLHTALVAADGRLADPEDLDFDDTHLDDPEALSAAITDLVKRKPGLRSQQIRGDVGAGERGSRKQAPTDLLTIMKGL